jgi:hypothetical protein
MHWGTKLKKIKDMTFASKLMVAAAMLLLPIIASAHQPIIMTGEDVAVTEPEISKAYYATLSGEPHIYRISETRPFELYVNVLVPDIGGQKKDVSAAIIKNGDTGNPLAVLDGANARWERFFEPFGRDWYWKGPEYKNRVDAGDYEIRVWSSNNDSKYSIAIGEEESFGFEETAKALTLIPEIKKNFFNESPAGFFLSPLGWGYILAMIVLAFIAGLILRTLSGKRRGSQKIGKAGRLLRLILAIGLLVWAILTTWNPILLFLSGFALFETAFGWGI